MHGLNEDFLINPQKATERRRGEMALVKAAVHGDLGTKLWMITQNRPYLDNGSAMALSKAGGLV